MEGLTDDGNGKCKLGLKRIERKEADDKGTRGGEREIRIHLGWACAREG